MDVSTSNITPFHEAIIGLPILGDIWNAAFSYPYMPWLLSLVLFVALQVRRALPTPPPTGSFSQTPFAAC